MRRLISGNLASTGDGQTPSEDPGGEGGADYGVQESRNQRDEREEKTAEVNGDDELFGPGHFQLDESMWDGLEAAYNLHVQLAANLNGLPCPICLRVSQLPVRQECGHVLCLQCMQQALASIGTCPLCQAQQIFKVSKSETPDTDVRTMGIAYTTADQDGHLPMSSTSSFLSSSQPSIYIQADHFHEGHGNSTDSVAVSSGFDAGRMTQDLLPNPNDGPLQLDNLSDLDDVIDLADLVSSDIERPSPAVAARTSRSGSFIAGPPRRPRIYQRKKSSSSQSQASPSVGGVETNMASKVSSSSAGRVGKRKARPRKSKRDELDSISLQWEIVETEGTPPDQRYDCGLAIYGSLLIVVGGIVGNLRLNDLHILDLAEMQYPRWIQPPICGTPPSSGNLLQIFVIGDLLYAIGGTIDGKYLTELHALNLISGEWKWERIKVAGTPPSMRYWYSVAVIQGMAILYGGYGHPNRLSDTFALRFDTETPTWVELQPRGDLPGPSSTHSVCVIKDRMYIFGGYDGKFRRSQLFAFELESVSNDGIDCVWHKIETQGCGPAARYTHSGANIDSQLIVYGGNSGCLKGDTYVLDLGTGEDIPKWKLARSDPPLTPRAWHRAVVYSDIMYVFGGHTSTGNDNQLVRIVVPHSNSATQPR